MEIWTCSRKFLGNGFFKEILRKFLKASMFSIFTLSFTNIIHANCIVNKYIICIETNKEAKN